MLSDTTLAALRDWLARQLANAHDVQIDACEAVTFGHSAETLTVTVSWRAREDDPHRQRRNMVLRVRPPAPGLLEPYDLQRQFTILRALEPTPVPAPAVYWYEATGTLLGREFYAMARIDGTVYEGMLPEELGADPPRAARMARSLIEALTTVHRVDLDATGLRALATSDPLGDELAHWNEEMQRVRLGPLPALERLARELTASRPTSREPVTLVHGDVKPGNFAYDGDDICALFDWELAGVGDPRADLGYLECMWSAPGSFTAAPGGLEIDDALALHHELTGVDYDDRPWFRALAGFKLAVILLVGSMLFERGASDDLRFASMGYGVPMFVEPALRDLGVAESLDQGPVTPSRERIRAVRAGS